MFENCIAYSLANEREWEARLSTVLREIGFRKSIRLDAAEQLDPSDAKRLHFLIMHSSMNRELIHKVTKLVRSSRDDKIRFMPMVVLLDAAEQSQVREFLNLGCDDIIIFPCSAKTIAQRLTQQVNKEVDYFKTPHYFGPDRRRLELGDGHPDRRDGEGSVFQHMIVKRSFDGEIKVLSTKDHAHEHEKRVG